VAGRLVENLVIESYDEWAARARWSTEPSVGQPDGEGEAAPCDESVIAGGPGGEEGVHPV